jgi:cytochrome bd ubiquinol oxidase subunit II
VPEPSFLLALIMVVSLTVYALFAGADFGGGVWDLLATGKTAHTQRATIAHAIAPVWEANHVWLILIVTVLFSGFPRAFASIGVSLHLPLMLALVGIVLRGSAFVFRAYGPTDEGFARRWGWVFAGASAITPLLLGATIGALTQGPADWLTPFPLAVGAFALVLFAYLAAVYLTLEAKDRETSAAFRVRALISAALTGVMALGVFILAGDAPHLRAGLTTSHWALPLHTATGMCALAAFFMLWTHRYWWARLAAATEVALIVWGWALAQYPYLVRPDLTIQSSAAPHAVLVLLLQILVVGAVVLIPSLVYLFRLFGPVSPKRPTGREGGRTP